MGLDLGMKETLKAEAQRRGDLMAWKKEFESKGTRRRVRGP